MHPRPPLHNFHINNGCLQLTSCSLANTYSCVSILSYPALIAHAQAMHRRQQHGSSGELDVFGAMRYFDGLATVRKVAVVVREPEDLDQMIIQAKMTNSDKKTEESHRDELAGVKTSKSKLAAFLESLVSPGRTSFRKKLPPPSVSSATTSTYADPPKLLPLSSSSTSSGRTSTVDPVTPASTVHGGAGGGRRRDDDFGVAMQEDRRLKGVRVVRGGDEERWVVRCGAWEEHQHRGHDKMMCGAEHISDEGPGWESDHDLFELDLQSI
ncbi:hypothetical protein GUJ93_ZPchr0003g18013 [Zizania palustris]|uniref:Uncharacterized protein n=1 Tax=Zizania palustris TaxID=103762 RepID=A0A8J5SM50_ZIZPA|nr:hypothetical protein GUJ93_ZPchr0003g18013 [Zizania palustris]